MIGDKRYTEAADFVPIRRGGVVGERDQRCEAGRERKVERWPVRMQTRVAINQMRNLVAVSLRVPG